MDDKTLQRKLNQFVKLGMELHTEAKRKYGTDGFFLEQQREAMAELKGIEDVSTYDFSADLEVLETYSREEIKEEIARYKLALEQKDAWDKLTEAQKDRIFDKLI